MSLIKKVRNDIRRTYYKTLGYYPAELNGVKFRCHPDDWRFWKKVKRGRWEPFTFKILEKFLSSDSLYFDVGAWVGPTVLYAARICREIYCFEPDPLAYKRLLYNLRLNKIENVAAFELAIHKTDGKLRIGNPGGLGLSESSILKTDSNNVAEVRCITFEGAVAL